MTYSGFIYHCSAGESFDSIALKIYGDEKYAAELLTANPSHCDKMVFTGGEKLRLPVVVVAQDEQTGEQIGRAPWKE